MTVHLTKLSAATSANDFLRIIDRDGAVIISNLMPSDALHAMHQELGPCFANTAFCQGNFFGNRTKRIHSLVVKSKICRTLVLNRLVLQIMQGVLGPFCDKIQLNLTQGIQIWPNETAQFIHRDDAMYPATSKACEFMINALWAYSEFTSENGATVVVPGSHKWKDRYRNPKNDEITQAEMHAGEVLIYLGSVLHGGGANRSLKPRTGIVFSYCLGWLRQYENQYLAAPPELAKNFPKELQDLLGYCVHRPNLGLYEGNEPSILFKPHGTVQTQDFLTEDGQKWVDQDHAAKIAQTA